MRKSRYTDLFIYNVLTTVFSTTTILKIVATDDWIWMKGSWHFQFFSSRILHLEQIILHVLKVKIRMLSNKGKSVTKQQQGPEEGALFPIAS